jgi:pimeloyl-ACP methyl ester carboxylesterase
MVAMRALLLCLLVSLLAGCGPQAATPTPAPTATPVPTPPDEAALAAGLRVDIGGRALFIRCVGPANQGPTVIFESGLAGAHDSWDAAQQQSAPIARSCSYDRAGMGQSDPAPTPRDGAAAAADLRALLGAAGVPGPYILVGHSLGALLSRLTASQIPDQVVGVVLVDPVHEDWWDSALAALPPEAGGDSERLRGFRQFLTVDVADPARNQEGFDIPAIAAQARAAGGLGARPLVVLSAGVFDVVAPGLPPDVESRLKDLFQRELPRRLTALSSDSTQVAVPDSGHNIPRQRPDIVVLAIQAVLSATARP